MKIFQSIFTFALTFKYVLFNQYDFLVPDILSDKAFVKIYDSCRRYTMTSIERCYSLYMAVNYVHENKIQGDFVECGVWKGGSSMLASMRFLNLGDIRNLYLYDTFQGMPQPSKNDVKLYTKTKAIIYWEKVRQGDFSNWDYSPLSEVEKNLRLTRYPKEKIFLVQGKVENTIPKNLPKKISILRIDTDWYESTYHCLKHLFPLLEKGGVLILDDYGHWSGAKKAADQYFKQNKIYPYLGRIDYTGRVYIKG